MFALNMVISVIIEADHHIDGLDEIAGILNIEQHKRDIRITIENEDIAKDIYKKVIEQGFVRRFQVLEPSLNDIL